MKFHLLIFFMSISITHASQGSETPTKESQSTASNLIESTLAESTLTESTPAESSTADSASTNYLSSVDTNQDKSNTSPVFNIKRSEKSEEISVQEAAQFSLDFRSFNGSNNNLSIPHMNESETQLSRAASPLYADGVSKIHEKDRPNPRIISSVVAAQSHSSPNPKSASDFLWQWGQFLDHDLDLTDGVVPAEPANIDIPKGDDEFDPHHSGDAFFPFNRSLHDRDSGSSPSNPRQQLNEITGWIDASNVYGSDLERAEALRMHNGTGKLKTSDGDLLPFNTEGLPNAGGDDPTLFVGGDVRVNEQIGLTVMHTLFVREHNRLADEIEKDNPFLSGDEIFEQARRIVAAQMQVITYKEFLPVLLGQNALSSYRGYDDDVDASISNVFSTAAYRLGHSMLSDKILRLDDDNEEIREGHLPLREAFFAPHILTEDGGLEPILRGLAAQVCQTIDSFVVDDVRNFLFGQPGQGGFDLVSLNIQRGRDHGLASYNDMRAAFGLPRVTRFSHITSSSTLQDRLSSVYDDVDDIDVWVAGLAEDPVPGSMLGALFHTIIKQQFEALRDGDRFWYERDLSGDLLKEVENTSLADIIRRNTKIDKELSDNVFIADAAPQIIGLSVKEALEEREGTAVTVTGVIDEGFNDIYALRMRDVNDPGTSIIVKLEPNQRDDWSPVLNPKVLGETIVVVGVRDLYALQSSIEYVTKIEEISDF